jgi:nucleoside 2-deoxyribosyltransferase
MKIFFSSSIRGGREDIHIHKKIVELLKNYGDLLSEFNVDEYLEEKEKKAKISDEGIHTNDLKLINECNVLVAEVSTPSLGVGYEIGIAEKLNKRILCLFKKSELVRLSAMINGNKKITVFKYETIQDLKPKIKNFFSSECVNSI